ncbi:hypothetical protein NDU88_004315 [Pleurodeles waltl]|uniref:Uncharacterized protein n=1 Tax=Pleurodeles waltl TaxID=8319 RepID=A0AAV7UEZ3_PLEWA|nr:hypothetical protein NDU88_004315 [Pleurodeles waltl]
MPEIPHEPKVGELRSDVCGWIIGVQPLLCTSLSREWASAWARPRLLDASAGPVQHWGQASGGTVQLRLRCLELGVSVELCPFGPVRRLYRAVVPSAAGARGLPCLGLPDCLGRGCWTLCWLERLLERRGRRGCLRRERSRPDHLVVCRSGILQCSRKKR